MKSKAGIFVEYLWLAIATVSLIAGLQQWYSSSLENAALFFVMLIVAVLMYSFRRKLRQNNKKN